MADEDIYASDTDPYAAPSISIAPKAPDINEERAQGYLRQYTDKASKHGATYEDIMKRRAAAVAQIQSQLDSTIQEMRAAKSGAGQGQVNLPLLALGAGLLQGSPAGTAGNFGQDLSHGLSGMGNAIARQRMTDSDFLKGVAELQQKSGALGDIPLRDQATNEQRQQMAAEAQQNRLEVALTKAGAGGAGKDPAKLKVYQEWKKSPGNENKSFDDFMKFEAANNARTPAELQTYEVFKRQPGNENVSFEEFKKRVSPATASGREAGKETATAAVGLPGAEQAINNVLDTVDRIEKHPGLPKAVGPRAYLHSIKGGDAYNFERQLDVLKSQEFLESVQKMRGLGALSDAEGKKLSDAISSIDVGQSEPQFRAQLKIVKDLMEKGRAVVRQKATGVAPIAGAKLAPNGDWVIQKDGKWFKVE